MTKPVEVTIYGPSQGFYFQEGVAENNVRTCMKISEFTGKIPFVRIEFNDGVISDFVGFPYRLSYQKEK